jgi:hypothetical protein
MNYNWFWLIIKSYKMELINRETFIKHWKTVQHLDEMQGGLEGRKHNERLICSFNRGRRYQFCRTASVQQSAAMEVL